MDTNIPRIPDSFYSQPFPFLTVDNHSELGDPNVLTVGLPDYRSAFTMENLIPLSCYTLMWYSLNIVVDACCWRSRKEGFRRRRLIGFTVSLLHSTMCGSFVFVYLCRNTRLMFASPYHYYSFLELQIILNSIGYFIYDSIDTLINDTVNVSCTVLTAHHIACVYFLGMPVVTHKFLLYAFWSLLMEVSSIFLHARALLNQSKLSTTTMIGFYRVVSYINVAAFIPFRFVVQTYIVLWTIVNYGNIHIFYFVMSIVCMLCFLSTNCALFLRVLHSDGFVCSKVSREQLGAFAEDIEYEEVEKQELRAEHDSP